MIINKPFKTPVEIKLWWPHNWLKGDPRLHLVFASYAQKMVNRLLLGGLQYGPAQRRKRYAERAQVELDAYKKTGNMEHLINMSNYGFLESCAPSHPNAHFDDTVDSVTRKEFGK